LQQLTILETRFTTLYCVKLKNILKRRDRKGLPKNLIKMLTRFQLNN